MNGENDDKNKAALARDECCPPSYVGKMAPSYMGFLRAHLRFKVS